MTGVSPSGLSQGGIPEGYSDRTPGGVRGKQGFNGEELDVSRGCHQVYPGASPPRLGGRTGRDKCGACVGKGQTKPDHGRKLRCEVCLHPHLRAAPRRKVALVAFFLSYGWELIIPASFL